MNLGALIATLGVDTAGLRLATAEMRRFEARANTSLASVNAKLVATGSVMKKFGRSMSMFVTAPMALVGGAAGKMYMGFESSMTKIVGLVGVAREQVDQWGQEILRIAPQLGKAPKELADAMFFITSAGVRGAEAMDVLEMSAKASAAGLGETKIVADLVTSAMNAYGKEVLSAEAATDVLVATVREGKAQADALAGSMGMVLPIASAMGVQFHEVGGAVAAMTRTGTNAQTASMQLRQILASLVKPAQQAEKAMWAMGTSSAALRKTIREDGLLAALMKIRELTNKYGEDTMAKVFPNIRALSGVLDIMGENLKDNEAIFESLGIAVGSTENAIKETAKTFEFKWKVAVTSATTALTVLGKTIAEQLIPLLKGFTERMQRLVMWFDNLNERQRTTIIRIAALTAVIGPLSMVLGWLVGSVIPGLIKVGWGAVRMFRALTLAMMKNPATAVAVGIAALAAHLLIFNRRAREATDVQEGFNEQLEATEQIANRRRIEKFLRDVGLLQKQLLETEVPGLFIEIEKLDVTEKALSRLTEMVAKLPVEYLKGVKDLVSGQIIELKRELENFVSTGNTLLDQIEIGRIEEDTKALQNALVAVNAELERAAEITALDGGVTPTEGLREQAAVMKTLAEDVRIAGDMEKVFGERFDETTALINAQQKAIEGLIALSVDPLDQRIRNMVTTISTLELALGGIQDALDTEQLDFVAESLAEIDKETRKATEGLYEGILAFHGFGKVLEESSLLAGILGNAFQGMSNVISNALNSTENVLQSFGKFFKDFIKGLIIKLVAAAIAALALAVVLSFIIPGANLGKIFSGLKEGASFGKIFGAGFKAFAGMQHGGIVPPGYPDDTYPAMLTTGEAVIPPGKLPAVSKKGEYDEVRFEIDGDKLVGLLRKQLALEENF